MKSVKITNVDLNGFMPETDEVIPTVISDLEDGQALLDKVDNIEESAKGITLTEQEIDGQKTGKLIFTDYQDNELVVQGGYAPDKTTIILTENNNLQAKGLQTDNGYLSGNVIEEIITAKGGYLDSYNFGTSTPTQEQLTDYAIQNIGTITQASEIWDKTRVINLYDHHTWVWDLNSEWWSDLGDIGVISDANNDGLHGLVTGAPNDGNHLYMGNIDGNGQININGLPELANQTASLHNEIIAINQKIPNEASSTNQLADKEYVTNVTQNFESVNNKTQTIDEYSTSTQYPSAEAVYNALQNVTVNSIDKYEVQDIVSEGMYDTHYSITANISNGTFVGNAIIGNNGTAEIVIIPGQIWGITYYPPETVTVSNCSYTYNNETGIIELSQPIGNVTISGDCKRGYSITVNVQGGTYTGNSFIYRPNGTATITVTPKTNFELPNSINVIGCNYNYDNTTGVIDLYNPSSDVTIEVICESNEKPYLTFVSDGSFTLSIYDNTKYWDGIIEYNRHDPEEPTDWVVWDGTSAISSQYYNDINKEVLFVRGSNNTYITGSRATNSRAKWVLTPSGTDLIDCNGNIENLLDYQMVANGQHPPMADHCFSRLFQANSYLRRCPAFRATTLNTWCYHNALRDCPELITLPALPALDLLNSSYYYMFYNDSKIKLSETQDSTYTNEYRIPVSGTGTIVSGATNGMFQNTGGSFTGVPSINTTYYTSNEIVE